MNRRTAPLLLCLALVGCTDEVVDLGDFAGFEEVTAQIGVAGELASGVCIGDFDGQLGPDLFFARTGPDRLYLNVGDGTFEEAAGAVAGDEASQGCGYADFDRDGDLDLIVTSLFAATRFLRNDGAGLLSEEDVGFGDTFNQRSVLVEDIDQDGWADAVLTTTQGGQASLMRNKGDGTFEDRTPDSPLAPIRRTWGGAFLDYDGDSMPDLFLAKDVNPEVDQLLRNEGGFEFSDATISSGLSNVNHAMGIAVQDIDVDGQIDLFVTNWGHHVLWLNEGGTFLDVANAWGVGTEGGASGWGTFFFDADHDGDLDLFVANGAGFLAGDPNTPVRPGNERNRFFVQRQADDGTTPAFVEAAEEAGLDDADSALGAAWGDLDGDGWVDIVVANRDGSQSRVFRNLGSDSGSAPLRIDLIGVATNPDGLGAQVIASACGLDQSRVRSQGASVLSAGEGTLHFGFAGCEEDVHLTVTWPGGETDELTAPSPQWGDEPITVIEGG